MTPLAMGLLAVMVAVCVGLGRWIAMLRRRFAAAEAARATAVATIAGLQAASALALRDRDVALADRDVAQADLAWVERVLRERVEADALDQLAAEQARVEAARTAAQRATDVTALDAFTEEIAADVWRDLGLNPEAFARDADLVWTGKLHEFLHYAALRLQDRNPVRTVGDVIRLLTRAA